MNEQREEMNEQREEMNEQREAKPRTQGQRLA